VLDPDKAVALGVRPGRAFAELKAGRAVVTAEGRTVQPSEVLFLTQVACIAAEEGGTMRPLSGSAPARL
jgi:hypothetical protein